MSAELKMRTKLESLRKQQGLMPREVIGGVVGIAAYRSYEKGLSVPKVDVAIGIANRLGVAVDQLWDEGGEVYEIQ